MFHKSIYSLEFGQRLLGFGEEKGIGGARSGGCAPFLACLFLLAGPGASEPAGDPLSSARGHAGALREGVAARVAVEAEVAALLGKWTRQANRIAEEAEEVAELGLRPECMERVVTHLEGNLEALGRDVDGVERVARRAARMNDNTANALQTLSNLVAKRATEIHKCEDRCGLTGK